MNFRVVTALSVAFAVGIVGDVGCGNQIQIAGAGGRPMDGGRQTTHASATNATSSVTTTASTTTGDPCWGNPPAAAGVPCTPAEAGLICSAYGTSCVGDLKCNGTVWAWEGGCPAMTTVSANSGGTTTGTTATVASAATTTGSSTSGGSTGSCSPTPNGCAHLPPSMGGPCSSADTGATCCEQDVCFVCDGAYWESVHCGTSSAG